MGKFKSWSISNGSSSLMFSSSFFIKFIKDANIEFDRLRVKSSGFFSALISHNFSKIWLMEFTHVKILYRVTIFGFDSFVGALFPVNFLKKFEFFFDST